MLIGYDRLGNKKKLNFSFKYNYDRSHEMYQQFKLLRSIDINENKKVSLSLPVPEVNKELINESIIKLIDLNKKYAVFHVGSSSSIRQWLLLNGRNYLVI